MQRTDFSEMTCSIARSLAVAGEPWSPLVLRDVWVGINRFDDLQRDLGVSRKVLAERLKHLVDEGMLERRLYAERPGRYDRRPGEVEQPIADRMSPVGDVGVIVVRRQAVDVRGGRVELRDVVLKRGQAGGRGRPLGCSRDGSCQAVDGRDGLTAFRADRR